MKLFGPLEGAHNELRQVAFQTLAGAPANPVIGEFYREAADGLVYQWSGAAWVYIGAVQDGTVTVNKIGAGAVTLAKLAADSVDASKIVDLSVGTAELGNAVVTLAKLAANSVDATKIVDGEVGTNELANLAVTAAKIANASISNAQIAVAAGIAKSKLAALNIVDADVAVGAAIARAKLDFGGGLVNADIAAAAGIALSKLATDPLARGNHTGTQVAATISDFAAAVKAIITVADTASLDLSISAGGQITGVVLDSPKLGGVVAANYELLANKNAANGYAGLGADGKLPDGLLPALSISDTFVVTSQAEMLALVAEKGDVAIRTDQGKSYILTANNPGVLANWQEILAPAGGGGTVLSVTGTAPITSTGGANPQIGLGADGVTQAHIANNAVGTGELIDDSVTKAKMANDSVGSAEIENLAVGTTELANDAITSAKIGDGQVTDAKIVSVAVAKVIGGIQKRTATIGNAVASSFVVNHALNTTDVQVVVKEVATGEVVYPTVFTTDANNVTVNFNGFVPAANTFRVVVLG